MVGAGVGLRSVGRLIPNQERVLYPAHRPPLRAGALLLRPALVSTVKGSHQVLDRRSVGNVAPARSGMTDQRDEERRRAEDEERLRIEKERRGEELREAWRRHHPSQSEQDEKGWPKKRS